MLKARFKSISKQIIRKAPPRVMFVVLVAVYLSLSHKELTNALKTFPALIERNTFAVFDWGEAEVNRLSYSWQNKTESNIAWAHEAGQSAVQSPTPKTRTVNSQLIEGERKTFISFWPQLLEYLGLFSHEI